MPGSDKYDDDEYVAKLLAEDARKSSTRYASVGLSALLHRRPAAAPKPNTKFLKNLVRGADSHNAALKKKEELEARIRLRNIREHGREQKREHHEEGRERKRRRRSADENEDERRHKHKHRRREERDPERRGADRDDKDRRRKHHDTDDEGTRHRSKDVQHKRSHKRRRKYYDENSDGSDEKHQQVHRSRSNRHRSSRKQGSDREKHRDRSYSRERPTNESADGWRGDSPRERSSAKKRKSARPRDGDHDSNLAAEHARRSVLASDTLQSSESDTDPLEDLVGPLPPSPSRKFRTRQQQEAPVVRGRGAARSKENSESNIDAHFSSIYDPTLEAHSSLSPPLSEDNMTGGGRRKNTQSIDSDWDMALEALKDRQMWKRKQTDRMRGAGWTDNEIDKWEKSALRSGQARRLDGGADGDISNVKWKKRGEEREWDRGKEKDP